MRAESKTGSEERELELRELNLEGMTMEDPSLQPGARARESAGGDGRSLLWTQLAAAGLSDALCSGVIFESG